MVSIFVVAFFVTVQSVLAAVMSGMLGSKDPEQVTIMAKQAGEVKYIPSMFGLFGDRLYFACFYVGV